MSMRPLRVLIVEDEPMIAQLLEMIVEEAGHASLGVMEDGATALEFAWATKPDLALVDIRLRGAMSGLELAAGLRNAHPPIKIVLASGSHDPETLARAKAVEPLAFLKKPFLPNHLRDLLERASADVAPT